MKSKADCTNGDTAQSPGGLSLIFKDGLDRLKVEESHTYGFI